MSSLSVFVGANFDPSPVISDAHNRRIWDSYWRKSSVSKLAKEGIYIFYRTTPNPTSTSPNGIRFGFRIKSAK